MANFLRDYQGLYVNGKWIAPESAEPVINPATEQTIARIPVGDQRTLDEAIAAARTAFDEGRWPRMRPAEGSALLMQFHGELAARSEEIASLVVAESGASQMLARFLHVQSSLEIFRTAVELAARREMMVPLAPQVTPSSAAARRSACPSRCESPREWWPPLLHSIFRSS